MQKQVQETLNSKIQVLEKEKDQMDQRCKDTKHLLD